MNGRVNPNGYGVLQPKYIQVHTSYYYIYNKYNSAEMMSGFLLIKLNFIRFNVITSNNMKKGTKSVEIYVYQLNRYNNKKNAGIFINL